MFSLQLILEVAQIVVAFLAHSLQLYPLFVVALKQLVHLLLKQFVLVL